MNSNICRVCRQVKKPRKLKLLDEDFAELIFIISGICKENWMYISEGLPGQVCLKCIEQLNLAKNIRKICIDSDVYWKTYLDSKSEQFEVKSEPSEANISNIEVLVHPQHTLQEDSKYDIELSQYNSIFPQTLDDSTNFHDDPGDDAEDCQEIKKTARKRKQPAEKKIIKKDKQSSTTTIGPFQCIHCGKILLTNSGLASHEKSHTQFGKPGRKNDSFICDFCGKTFIQKSYLYVHLFSSHVKHDKGFRCEYCNRFFYKRVRYVNHINSHKNIRPYGCSLCPKTFIQKRNLDVHLRVHTGERPYQCQFCEKSYAHHSDRKRHVMMAHTGERPYVCKICGKGYVKRSCLTAHEKTHGLGF